MSRIAVFVDAGYLFAQGGAAVAGAKSPRSQFSFDASVAVGEFKAAARTCAPACELLRIYWYDGAIGGTRPTADQAILAELDDVKLRLGFVNSHGQQKGVDSLIVTDLIELARLKSISDALLLSGDEDVRIGVQIAQNHGVRVHLLGIAPSRGSQSITLIQEADTTTEWGRDVVSKFLSARKIQQDAPTVEISSAAATSTEALEETVHYFVAEMQSADLDAVQANWNGGNRGVPPDLDKRLLSNCRSSLGRQLDGAETRSMRAHFRTAVLRSIETPARKGR